MLDQALIWAVKKLPEPKNSRLSAKLIRVLTRISEDNADGKSARAALIVFLIRTISAVIAFGLQIFLARWLGGTQYGVFVLVWATAAVIAGLSCFGLQTAVIRFITEYRSKKDKASLKGILLAAPLISVASSIVFAILGLLILHLVWRHYHSKLRDAVLRRTILPTFIGIGRYSGWYCAQL